ncbi:hypothetical protein CCR75_002029 [Bremia lactucae]|uniref:Uncharacterized protein n=1 Tax=Bremia lactucae TaxID=4779 RepID=A0A976FFE2_BRELC|nr:hypothetical protein CCR75_002029 [Bremia lactucae]
MTDLAPRFKLAYEQSLQRFGRVIGTCDGSNCFEYKICSMGYPCVQRFLLPALLEIEDFYCHWRLEKPAEALLVEGSNQDDNHPNFTILLHAWLIIRAGT